MLSSQFPPRWGGVGVVIHGQVEALAARGHDIDVVTRELDPGMSFPPMPDNVRIHEAPMLKLPMAFTTSFGKHAVRKLLGLGRDLDVVHCHSNMTLLQRRHYWEIPVPITSTMHGTWWGERSQITWKDVTPSIESINDLAVMYVSPIFDVYEDYALRYSNAAFVECDNEERAVAARGVENYYGRILRLSAGIDAERFKPENADPEVLRGRGVDPDRPVVLFVGRLAARKGIFDMVEIFIRAHGEIPESQLVIVGEGPQEASLRGRIHRRGLSEAVTMTASVPFRELQALYATAHVVMYPSFWEGQGLIAGEAMASGTPCLATNVGWIPEIIKNGENGYRFPARDVEEGSRHLVTMLEDLDRLEAMGRRGRQDILGDTKPPRDA
jgi:glycosyltransferase involved in cell wall biosynthesis